MTESIKTRKAIVNIADIKSFKELLDACTLSSEEKRIMELHYIEKKDFAYIGDTLGYAEITVQKKHSRILSKLSRIIKP